MFSSISYIVKSARPILMKNELPRPTTTKNLYKPTTVRNLSDKIKSNALGDDEPDNSSNTLAKIEPREILAKEFPTHYSDGKFITRISYVDFIDQALAKFKELGLEKNLEAYKELLRVFPPEKYHPKSQWDIGMFHAPQQLAAIRILFQMECNLLKPDKEVERLVVRAFSKHSEVWLKVARLNFWSMKARNIDPYPLPEVIPQRPHEMAKVAITRMLDDPKSVISVRNTSSLPDSVDKTWVVYSQSPVQQSIIDKLDEKTILYLEEGGLAYVGNKYLTYFILRTYEDKEKRRERASEPEPDFDYNTLKVKFYGKPIKEKLTDLEMVHHVGDGYILSICLTGTSSHDSVLSWLKFLQQRNPKLNKLSVVFKMKRATTDIIDPLMEQGVGKRTASN